MAKYTPRHAPDHDLKGWPKGVPFIIGNEGCERFSYYGMKAILAVYIAGLYVNMMGMTGGDADNQATEVMHTWGAAVYSLPLIGAIISDRLLGKYRTILWLSIVYCLGHLALALFENPAYQQSLFGEVYIDPIQGLFIGLGLIAVGSGGIKPCVSAHVGDQFGRANWPLLPKVYNAFYFIINFGSAFATLLIPWIRGSLVIDEATGIYHYTGSVGWAFGVPGILMGIATIFFWGGRKVFVHVPATHPGWRGILDVLSGTALFAAFLGALSLPPHWAFGSELLLLKVMSPGVVVVLTLASLATFVVLFNLRQRIEPDDGFLALTFYTLKAKLLGLDSGPGEAPSEGGRDLRDHWLYGPAARRFSNDLAEGPIAVWKIISVFFFVSVFWGLFHQHSSTWVFQARDMNRVVAFGVGTWLGIGALAGFAIGGAFALTLAKTKKKRNTWIIGGVVVGVLLGWATSSVGPFTVEASQVPATNPFLVMLLIPWTSFGLYPLMAKLGLKPHPLRRMTIGMMMAGLAFVCVAVIQWRLDNGHHVHIVWQLIPYFVITLSEVMVSVTGLEFAYSQSPKRMKSVIMGFWLLNSTLGDVLVIVITQMEIDSRTTFFMVFAGLMFAAGILFGIRARFYKYRDFTQ